MLNDHVDNTHIHPIGTAVTIVDFEQLKDGLLGITVAGQGLFKVQQINVEDGLRVGHVRRLTAGRRNPCREDQLASHLKKFIKLTPS